MVCERQLRFHHVSLRGVIHTYVHTRDQYQYPLNLTVAYFEPPALIAYLKCRGEESRCNLHAGAPRMLCDREMADGNKRLWRRYSDIISARNWISSKTLHRFGLLEQQKVWGLKQKIDQRHDGLTNALCDLVSNYWLDWIWLKNIAC